MVRNTTPRRFPSASCRRVVGVILFGCVAVCVGCPRSSMAANVTSTTRTVIYGDCSNGTASSSVLPGNDSSAANAMPLLTWCGLANPYILSDFVSRNGTQLTIGAPSSPTPPPPSGNATTLTMITPSTTPTTTTASPPGAAHTATNRSDQFTLNVWCAGGPAGDGTATGSRFDISAAAGGEDAPLPTNVSIQRSCGALREIRGASYANATSVTRLVMFTDVNGQMLFLDFNKNRMSSTLTIGVAQVTHFDATQALTVNPSTGQPVRQDLVFLVGNASLVAIAVINGDTGVMTPSCVVARSSEEPTEQNVLILVTFDLPAGTSEGNAALDINLVFAWQYNISYGTPQSAPLPAWMVGLYQVMVVLIPATQSNAYAFINRCPQSQTPNDVQLLMYYWTVEGRTPRMLVKRNLVSNTTFVIVYTPSGVIVYIGSHRGSVNATGSGDNTTTFVAQLGVAVDWCINRTLYDPDTTGLKVYPRSRATVYCAPSGYIITAVDAYFMPPFDMAAHNRTQPPPPPNTHTASILEQAAETDPKVLWLAIAVAPSNPASDQQVPYVHVMPLTELANVPQRNNTYSGNDPAPAPIAQPSTPGNPLALPSSFGSAQFPCNFDTEWFDTATPPQPPPPNQSSVPPQPQPSNRSAPSCALGWRTTTTQIPYQPVPGTTSVVTLQIRGCCRPRRTFRLPLSQVTPVSRIQSRTVRPLKIVNDTSFNSDAFDGASSSQDQQPHHVLESLVGILEEPYVAVFVAQNRVISVATALYSVITTTTAESITNETGAGGSYLGLHVTTPPLSTELLATHRMPDIVVAPDIGHLLTVSNVPGVARAHDTGQRRDFTSFSQSNDAGAFADSNGSTTVVTFVSAAIGVDLQSANEVVFLGDIDYFFVSDNGQHLLAAVRRGEWELLSQQRYQRICERLAEGGDTTSSNSPTTNRTTSGNGGDDEGRNATSTYASANVFLQPAFGAACAAQAPEPINLNSFAQYASFCSFSTLCPSLSQPLIALPSAGYYADRPAVRRECPRGSFCSLGQKTQCPPGFYCDRQGMAQPLRCPFSANFSATCANWGQTAPQPCPDGTVCLAPHIPGFPAPPGFMVPAAALSSESPRTAATLRTSFLPCPDGSWCPLGTQQPFAAAATIGNTSAPSSWLSFNVTTDPTWTQWCPANSFCPASAVISPTLCVCDDQGNMTFYDPIASPVPPSSPPANASSNTSSSPSSSAAPRLVDVHCRSRTMYCPTATTNVTWCPAGYYCTLPNVSIPCVSTQYCPEGTFAPELCPAGTYCDWPNVSIMCPKGSYCPAGSVVPVACHPLVYCPAGSEDQSLSFIAPVTLLGVVAAVLVGFYAYARYDKRRQLHAQEVAVSMSPTVRNFLRAQGALPTSPRRVVSSSSSAGPAAVSAASAAPREGAGDGSDPADTACGTSTADIDDNVDDPSLHQELLSSETQLDAMRDLVPTSTFATPTIEFRRMGLTLAKGECKGNVVLDDVTGVIKPGSFVAVMGPSGSGKSTFMHTLAGKAFYGHRSGQVLLNGDEVDLLRLAKVIGFVKQDDIMHREMTVFETLLFNARMRYDASNCMESAESIANATMKVLDLNHVRDTAIGDEKKRGISGGQRKRVNIGMEMAALPSILFLDEPTSGLDSFSSMTVCTALRAMADAGITVIAVIHQPRYEIFTMFHQVLLLAKGGKLVFFDEPQAALPYFENVLGVKCPPHVNPPDFFMDTISGETLPYSTTQHGEGSASGGAARLTIDGMARIWQQHAASSSTTIQQAPALAGEGRSSGPPPPIVVGGSSSGGPPPLPLDPSHRGRALAQRAERKQLAGFFSQLRYFVDRSITQLSRDLIWFFTDLILVLISGLFLGLVFSRSQYRPAMPAQIVNRSLSCFGPTAPPLLREFFDRPIDDPIISEASFSCMAIGMTGVTAALRVFGPEQIVYWREASAGMSTTAYFLAKNLTHFMFILLSPLLYMTPFLTFVSCRASFLDFYRVLFVTQFATTGLGYVVSILAPSGLAQLAGVVVVLVFTMFGGARPTLVEIQEMFPLLHVMPYLSYIRWAQEAMYLTEMREWNEIQGVNIQPSLKLFDYHLDDYALCMAIVVYFGVAFRLFALLGMLLMHREQKH